MLRVGIKAQNDSVGNASSELAHSISNGDIEAPSINYLNSGTISLGSNTVGMVALNNAVVLNANTIQTIRGEAALDGYSFAAYRNGVDTVDQLPQKVQDILRNPNHADYNLARVACYNGLDVSSSAATVCGFGDDVEAIQMWMSVSERPEYLFFLARSGFVGFGIDAAGDTSRFNAGMVAGENSIAINKQDIFIRNMTDISSSANVEAIGMLGDTGSVLLNEGNITMETSPITPKQPPYADEEYDDPSNWLDVYMTGMAGLSFDDQRVYLENTGTISLEHHQDYDIDGDGMSTVGYLSTMINNGQIVMNGSGGRLQWLTGMLLSDWGGDHVIENNGDIVITGTSQAMRGIGIDGRYSRSEDVDTSFLYERPDISSNIKLTNTGKIQVSSEVDGEYNISGRAIEVVGVFDNIDIINQGEIKATNLEGGVFVDLSEYDDEVTEESVLNLLNRGSISVVSSVSGTNAVWNSCGINLGGDGQSIFRVTNSGTISAESIDSIGMFIHQGVDADTAPKEFTLVNEASGIIKGSLASIAVGGILLADLKNHLPKPLM